jgi:hypothetical protein
MLSFRALNARRLGMESPIGHTPSFFLCLHGPGHAPPPGMNYLTSAQLLQIDWPARAQTQETEAVCQAVGPGQPFDYFRLLDFDGVCDSALAAADFVCLRRSRVREHPARSRSRFRSGACRGRPIPAATTAGPYRTGRSPSPSRQPTQRPKRSCMATLWTSSSPEHSALQQTQFRVF